MSAPLQSRPVRYEGAGGLGIVGDEWGEQHDSTPVLLLHGGGQNRHAWKGTASRLARAGHNVVAVDARGHGDSEWSAVGHYDMEHFAADVAIIVATFDRRPVVVGASMGGMSALLAQGRHEQQLYRAVVLVDVTPRMEMSGVSRIVGFMTARPGGFASLEEAAEVIAAYNPHRASRGDVSGLRRVLRRKGDRWVWRWDPNFLAGKADLMSEDEAAVASRMDQMASDLHRAARRITVPTLLVRGGESDLVSEASVREFLAAVPHADYVDVSGAGHMVAGDDNDAFTSAVLDFLVALDG
jgi:pimeloyl-ACP methyl ester carboxylesterase